MLKMLYNNEKIATHELHYIYLLFPAGILINVECKAWAKNIKHSRNDKIGAVHFELMID